MIEISNPCGSGHEFADLHLRGDSGQIADDPFGIAAERRGELELLAVAELDVNIERLGGEALLAGGGLTSGVVVGSSTRAGDLPADRPVHFNDVIATIYWQLGVRSDEVFYDALAWPVPVLARGKPIAELL